MRTLCIAALLLLFHLATQGQTVTPPPTGHGLWYSPQEIAAWRIRAQEGPYRAAGDQSPNSPADWQRITAFADQFRARPYVVGNSTAWNADTLTLWNGYDGAIDTQDQYPGWQGIKMQAAAVRYLVTGDTSYAGPVRRCLARQFALSLQNRARGADVGAWPPYSNSRANGAPTYFSGAKEALWLTRLLLSYDAVRSLCTGAERDTAAAFFLRAARYFSTAITRRSGGFLPSRLAGTYTDARSYWSVAGERSIAPPANIWATPNGEGDRKAGWPTGTIYTHRNANGSYGNRISISATWINNATLEKVPLLAGAGVLFSAPDLVAQARATVWEWVTFSLYPDGTTGEYERNGDYGTGAAFGNPAQGATYYMGMCLQSVVLAADMLARRGDTSLFTYQTRAGVHGTQVAATAPPKSLRTALDRYASIMQGLQGKAIFYGTGPLDANSLIGPTITNPAYMFSTRNLTWDGPVLAIANRWYRSPEYLATYTRNRAGVPPYAATNLTSAGKIPLPWSGTGAELAAPLFLYGQMEGVEIYNRPATWATVTGGGRVTAGPRNFVLTVADGGRPLRLVEWRQVSGTPIRIEARGETTAVVAAATPLAPVPVGTYTIRVLAVATNGERAERQITLSVEP